MVSDFEVKMLNFLLPPEVLVEIKTKLPKHLHKETIDKVIDARLKILDACINLQKVAKENYHNIEYIPNFTVYKE